MNLNNPILIPQWNAPANIKSLQTMRIGGVSKAPFDSFNLAEHVNDNVSDVKKNRQKLLNHLPAQPIWLNQIHSNTVVDAASSIIGMNADGSYSTRDNVVCVVMTADCLPVLMCNRQGNAVAAIHAGWRGLLDGILEQGIHQLLNASLCLPEDVRIWFGPAIGPEMFEVGDEVRQAFLDKEAANKASNKLKTADCFIPSKTGSRSHKENIFHEDLTVHEDKKWLADLYQLAKIRLSNMGVKNFSGGTHCTYKENKQFYSYRRDGITGRMASLIWIEGNSLKDVKK